MKLMHGEEAHSHTQKPARPESEPAECGFVGESQLSSVFSLVAAVAGVPQPSSSIIVSIASAAANTGHTGKAILG